MSMNFFKSANAKAASENPPEDNNDGAEPKLFNWFAAIVEATDDVIIGVDLSQKIIFSNKAACSFFGYNKDELIGQPVKMLIPEKWECEESKILAQAGGEIAIKHLETIRQRKDGSQADIVLTISPVKDGRGNLIGTSSIIREISDGKLTGEKLKASLEREKIARQNAEDANRAKDNFLATLSHELRTPLNPVLLIASDAINDRELPPRIRTNFENIRKNIELEARLIDDLLYLTSVNSGQINLELQIVDVQQILDDVIANLKKDAAAKEVEIILKRSLTDSPMLGDANRLRQIFGNVLKNAIKFTPAKGMVTVEVDSDYGDLIIKVSDTGIGMTSDEIANAFSAFSENRLNSGRPHRFGGLGLGLAISQKLIELHSGKIEAASAGRDQGSTITITLPLEKRIAKSSIPAASTSETVPLLPKAETKGLRILLVEDHESTCSALASLLLRRNYKIVTAGSVAEAREQAAKEKIDLVISDIGLPDGDGNDLMKELSSQYGLKGIALTGFGMDDDIKRNLEAGFVAHLTKPVNIRSLENVLALPALINR